MRWFQPRSALFWVYCVVTVGGALALGLQLLPIVAVTWSGIVVGLPFTLATLLAIGAIILQLDPFRAHRSIRTPLWLGFVWGAAAGPGIAMFANDNNIRAIQNLAGQAFATDWQAPISAAIVEEGIKGLGVFAVAWLSRPLLRRPMHGLLLGAFTGLGFQITEDVVYEANAGLTSAQGDIATSLLVGILRLITGITSHWMLTSLAGIGIVVALSATHWSRSRRVGFFLGFYLLGMALHFVWDAPIGGSGAAGIGSIVRRALVDLVVFALVYAWVLRTERRWFRGLTGWAVAQHLAPPGELDTLISHRSRHRARRAVPVPAGIMRYRQRQLLDWVQAVDAATNRPPPN